jgi:hypothetical protein
MCAVLTNIVASLSLADEHLQDQDLDEDDKETLKSVTVQIIPARDRSSRVIVCGFAYWIVR